MKKQTIHDIRSKCKFRNDPAESIENNNQHKTKEDPWKHLKSLNVTFDNKKNLTQVELVEHKEFAKESDKRFQVHQDNGKGTFVDSQLLQQGNANQIRK